MSSAQKPKPDAQPPDAMLTIFAPGKDFAFVTVLSPNDHLTERVKAVINDVLKKHPDREILVHITRSEELFLESLSPIGQGRGVKQ